MHEEDPQYRTLPRLRAELAELRTGGHEEEARELERTIAQLTGAVKRDAARIVHQREKTKERFQQLVEQIRELQGSVSQVAGGRDGRQAEVRKLTARALAEKSRYRDLNAQVREFKWHLSGVERPGQQTGQADTAGEPTRTSSTDREAQHSDAPAVAADETAPQRRRWLIPALVAAIVAILATGLLIASVIFNQRAESALQDELAAILLQENLDEIVRYGKLSVSAIHGSVTVTDVVLGDPASGETLRVGTMSLRVPHAEALRARQAIERGETEQVVFFSMWLNMHEAHASGRDGEMVRAKSMRVALNGNLGVDLLEASGADQLLAITRAEVTLTGLEASGFEDRFEPLGRIGWTGDLHDLTHIDEIHIDVSHDESEREFRVAGYRLQTPLLSQSGNGLLAYEGHPQRDGWIREIKVELHTDLHARPGALAIPTRDASEVVNVDLPAVTSTVRGVTTFADASMEFDLRQTSAAFSIIVGPGAITVPAMFLDELAWELEGIDEFIADGRLQLDRLAIDIELLPGGKFELRELEVDSPWVALKLSGRTTIDQVDAMAPASLSLDGSVDRLPRGVHEPLAAVAMMMGASSPPIAPFSFRFSLDAAGGPRLIIE